MADHPVRESLLKSAEIDVVAVLVGILVARIVVLWYDVLWRYYQAIFASRVKQDDEAWHFFWVRFISAIICTFLIALVMIIIYSWSWRDVHKIIHERAAANKT